MDEPHLCPYLEREDARCDGRLTLRHVGEAFHYCVCEHEACPVFREIRAEDRSRKVSRTLRCVA